MNSSTIISALVTYAAITCVVKHLEPKEDPSRECRRISDEISKEFRSVPTYLLYEVCMEKKRTT